MTAQNTIIMRMERMVVFLSDGDMKNLPRLKVAYTFDLGRWEIAKMPQLKSMNTVLRMSILQAPHRVVAYVQPFFRPFFPWPAAGVRLGYLPSLD